MYDINVNNVKKGNNIYIVFLAFGLLFLIVIGGYLVYNFLTFNSLDSTTTSTRVEVESYMNDEGTMMYSPVYYYTVNNKDYICGSNSSSNINPGKTNRTVYYDSKNPENCMTEHSKSSNWLLAVFLLIPTVVITVSIIGIRKVSKRIAIIKELNQKGKLIKNLPYHLEYTGIVINDVPIQRPVIEYTLPSGSTVTLLGDPRHDKRSLDKDGMVDLVIDEDNPDNYFIDFEINRLSGNLPTDYYTPDSDSKDAA